MKPYVVRRLGLGPERAANGVEMTRLLERALAEELPVEVGVAVDDWCGDGPGTYWMTLRPEDRVRLAYLTGGGRVAEFRGTAAEAVAFLRRLWGARDAVRAVLAWKEGDCDHYLILHRRV